MKLKNLLIGFIVILTLNCVCFAESEFNSKAIKAYNNGIDLTNQEKYSEAVQYFKEATKIEPSFTDAYYNLGIIYQYLGKQDEALNSFLTILDYSPEDYEVIYKIAVMYHNKGENHTALDYIKKIPPEDPNFGLMTQLVKTIETEQKKVQKFEEIKAAAEAEKIKQVNNERKIETYTGFEGPTGVVRDGQGNLYVANYSDNSIICIDVNGERKVVAQDGPLKGPLGLAVDKKDNIYVANYESNQIVVMPAADRSPLVLPFIVNKPYFLMVDENGVLFVTEQGTNTVSQHKLDIVD